MRSVSHAWHHVVVFSFSKYVLVLVRRTLKWTRDFCCSKVETSYCKNLISRVHLFVPKCVVNAHFAIFHSSINIVSQSRFFSCELYCYKHITNYRSQAVENWLMRVRLAVMTLELLSGCFIGVVYIWSFTINICSPILRIYWCPAINSTVEQRYVSKNFSEQIRGHLVIGEYLEFQKKVLIVRQCNL